MATNKPAFVEVIWEDPWSDAVTAVTLRDVVDTHKPELITTRGWLLYEDEKGISLACEECADGSYRGRSYILKVLVKDVTPLTLARARRKPAAAPVTQPVE